MMVNTLTPEDLRLKESYVDWVHANTGDPLHGGIAYNKVWHGQWCEFTVMPSFCYTAPSFKIGGCFVGSFVRELCGVRYIRWNLEQFIVFKTVILQRAQHVTASHTIQRWI